MLGRRAISGMEGSEGGQSRSNQAGSDDRDLRGAMSLGSSLGASQFSYRLS